jgi:endonuclease/exonuclease/phosphatase family metal-dependent hydrolase
MRSSFFGSRRLLPALATAALALITACGQGGTSPTSSGAGGETGSTSGATTGTSGDGGGGGNLPAAMPLAILDWNTHNFFDTKKNSPDPSETVLSVFNYNAKRKAIGAVIKNLDADIVVLAEVENLAILDDLNTTELDHAYAKTILIDGNDSRGIDIGMLTKLPPESVVSHKDDVFVKAGTNGPQYHYSRDCLEVHFTFNQRKLIVLGVHFKAKAAPDDPDKRLAEGQHTRAIADALQAKEPGAAIVVLGDFNDTTGSAPYNAVLGAAPTLFADSADAVPAAEHYSYDYQGKLELIDHQMANPRLAALIDPAQVLIAHGKGIDDGSQYASDHAPIKATYLVH